MGMLQDKMVAEEMVAEENSSMECSRLQCQNEASVVDIRKVCVRNLGGDALVDELTVPVHEKVFHMKALIEDQTGIKAKHQKLLHGDGILTDDTLLSDTAIKDGDTVTLLRNRLSNLLHVKLIDDSVQTHGTHKLALQSKPLEDTIEKIEVTVAHWEDQNWGGKQARLFIYLYDPSDGDREVALLNLFGCLRTDEYDDRKHRSSPRRTVSSEEDVVSMARPGMVYKLKYQLGGGGGHTIKVKDWKCTVFPRGCSIDEPDDIEVVSRVGEAGRAYDRHPKVGPDGHREK